MASSRRRLFKIISVAAHSEHSTDLNDRLKITPSPYGLISSRNLVRLSKGKRMGLCRKPLTFVLLAP